MNLILKWTEISDQPQNKRFEILSAELTASGLANEFMPTELAFEFLDEEPFKDEDHCDKFREFMNRLKNNFDQIRIGGFFQKKISLLSHEYPAELFQTQVADALVHDASKWWPRNFLFRAIQHLLVQEMKQVDFSNPVLIIGTEAESKTFISALIKMGFTRFNITGRDFHKCKILVEEMKRNYFSTRFESTEMNYLTQLPNIYSLSINTLDIKPEEDLINSLIYFNFLAMGGYWVESVIQNNVSLSQEAKGLGFQVKFGTELAAELDSAWAESVFGCQVDLARLKASYQKNLLTSH